MKKNMGKKLIVTLLTLFLFVGTNITIPSAEVQTSDSQKINEKTTFEFTIIPSDFEFNTIDCEGETYTTIELKEEGYSNVIGEAKIPKITRMVEIPTDAIPIISSVKKVWEYQSLDDMGLPTKIVPVQPSIVKNQILIKDSEFIVDYEYYKINTFTSEDVVRIVDIGEIRGHCFALVEISPVKYNPATGELKLLKSCNIRIDFVGGDYQKTYEKINRYYSDSFNSLFKSAFINYDMYSDIDSSLKDAEGYLIIVYDSFYDEILPFVNWKQLIGFDVTTTLTSEIPGGPTKENIHAYIEDAYDNWQIPPAYVLLVGDTGQIPTYTGYDSYTAADLYYVTITDGDYFPDIHIGRYPASTGSHVTAMVDKTLCYEQKNYPSNDFLTHAVFMASTDNYAVSEGTHNYVIDNYLEPNDWEYDKLYTYTYGATTQQVRNAINDGRILAVFSGHGSTTSWSDGPYFSQTDVNNLMNTGLYPFVFSHACITGKFTNSECFGETWLRAADKASIIFWGSSANTFWPEDDILEKRTFRAWWEDGLEVIGAMTDRGMYYLYQYYSGGGDTQYYFECYNILGDPSLVLARYPIVYDNDVEAVGITSPDSTVSTGDYTVSAIIENVGNFDQSDIPVSCEIFKDLTSVYYSEEIIVFLAANDSIPIDFTPDWTATPGVYTIYVTTLLPGDEDTMNDQTMKTITVIAEKDAGVVSINHPSSLERPGVITVSATVENTGMIDQNIPVNCEIYNSSEELVYNANTIVFISAFSEEDIDFFPDWGVSVFDNYRVEVTTVLEGDEDSSNDYLESMVAIQPYTDASPYAINMPDEKNPGGTIIEATIENLGDTDQMVPINCKIYSSGELPYEEDFEGDDGGYLHGGLTDLWEWGTPTFGPDNAYSGNNCWGTVLDGEYPNYGDATLDSIPISLPGGMISELTFWHWYDIEPRYDGGNVKISTDGGTNWEILGNYPDPYNEDAAGGGNEGIPGEPCFSGGDQQLWEQVTFDLSDYVGEIIMLRFHFATDRSKTYAGWYIDDVSIDVVDIGKIDPKDIVYEADTTILVSALNIAEAAFSPPWIAEPGNYRIKLTTQLSGDENPENDILAKKITITDTVICGDVNADEKLNVVDLTYLVAYMFGGGSEPTPLCSGDITCDESINIADLTYLVAYLFAGGPLPGECCCNL